MRISTTKAVSPSLLSIAILACAGLCGCQANIGGQTLPSSSYLVDDVQYFAPGPEQPLHNQVRAMNEYRAQQGDWNKDLIGAP